MSWHTINKTIGIMYDVGNRTGTAKRKVDASKNRLFRISIMACACLLMNTAATVSMAIVLHDWSVSSNLWLTCTIFEGVFLSFHLSYRYISVYRSYRYIILPVYYL
jgi:hypothetical protein